MPAKKSANKVEKAETKTLDPKPRAKKTSKKVAGIAEMTREKHSYEGYSVRTQIKGNIFRRYVSASAVNRKEKSDEARKKGAYAESVALITSLREVLVDKKSWNESDVKPSCIKKIKDLGFRYEKAKVSKSRTTTAD